MGSSTNTRNFGVRRFTNLVREGRFRAPASTALRLGTFVEMDPNDNDRVREADNATIGIGGSGDVRAAVCGILWYEHDSQTFNSPAFGGAAGQLPQDLDTAPAGRMVQVLHGRGSKFWFRNTAAATTEPGLNFANTRAEVIMVDGLGATPTLSAGDLLGWDSANNFYTATSDLAEAIFVVTKVDGDTVDAEMLI